MSLRIFIMLAAWLGLNIYALVRMLGWLGVKLRTVKYAAGLCVGILTIAVKILYGRRIIDSTGILNKTMDLWMGYLLLLITTMVLFEIIGLVMRKLKRRAIFYCVLGISLSLSVWSFFAAKIIAVKKLDLPASVNCRIVQLSDLHLGYMSYSHLDSVIEKTNALNPDIVILAGDLVDRLRGDDYKKLEKLAAIKAPVYFVMGNHEGYVNFRKVEQALEKTSLIVLRNAWAEPIDGLKIFGVDDYRDDRLITDALAGNHGSYSDYDIFVCHRPVAVEDAASKKFDLMLSGHTHAGQIIPFGLAVRLVYPYFYGLYEIGNMKLNVSSGAGFWGPPMRFPMTGEIVCIDLKRE